MSLPDRSLQRQISTARFRRLCEVDPNDRVVSFARDELTEEFRDVHVAGYCAFIDPLNDILWKHKGEFGPVLNHYPQRHFFRNTEFGWCYAHKKW